MFSYIFPKVLLGIICLLSVFYSRKAAVFSFFCICVCMAWDVRIKYLLFNYLDIVLAAAVIVFFARELLSFKKIYVNRFAVILSFFLCWAVISLLVNDMSSIGIKRLLKFVLRYGIYILFIPMMIKTERNFWPSVKSFVFGGCVVAFGYIAKIAATPQALKNLFLDPLHPDPMVFLGWSGHDLGHYMSIIILLLLGLSFFTSGTVAKILWASVPCSVAVLGLSLTKSAWLGFIVSLCVFMLHIRKHLTGNLPPAPAGNGNSKGYNKILESAKAALSFLRRIKRKIGKYGLLVIIFCLCFFAALPSQTQRWLWANFKFQDVSEVTRIRVWKCGLNMIEGNPVFGVGFYNFEKNFKAYDPGGILDDRTPTDPHNWWIRICAETGVPGLLLFLVFYYGLFRKINRSLRKLPSEEYKFKIIGAVLSATLVSIFVQGFFEATFMWSYYVWAVFAVSIIYVKIAGEKTKCQIPAP